LYQEGPAGKGMLTSNVAMLVFLLAGRQLYQRAAGLLVLCVKVIYEGSGLANSVFFSEMWSNNQMYCFSEIMVILSTVYFCSILSS
jgi:hypothetical protein